MNFREGAGCWASFRSAFQIEHQLGIIRVRAPSVRAANAVRPWQPGLSNEIYQSCGFVVPALVVPAAAGGGVTRAPAASRQEQNYPRRYMYVHKILLLNYLLKFYY